MSHGWGFPLLPNYLERGNGYRPRGIGDGSPIVLPRTAPCSSTVPQPSVPRPPLQLPFRRSAPARLRRGGVVPHRDVDRTCGGDRPGPFACVTPGAGKGPTGEDRGVWLRGPRPLDVVASET